MFYRDPSNVSVMKLRYGPPVDEEDDFVGIVGRTKDLHTITRSTVPLMAWWRDDAQEKLLPGTDLSNAIARFEYAVTARCASCGGKGKSSMTDVMVQLDDQAIAIEAKYTEPKYESVNSWRKKGKDPANRERVLKHWCHLIENLTGVSIEADLGGLVYQTVHRAASACAATPRGGVAHVMYLAFRRDGDAGSDYEGDLREAARVLDPQKKMSFSVVTIPTSQGRDFNSVAEFIEAATTDDDRVEVLADALLSKCALYQFGEPVRVRIQ